MSQSQSINFLLDQSGAFRTFDNTLADATSLELDYVISGAPDTISLVLEGLNTDGTVNILDTYTTVADTVRTVSLAKTYASFRLTASWTGGAKVSVNTVMKTTGSGAVSAAVSPLPLQGIGSPVGVVVAAIGQLYINLSGGSGTTLYVKESGNGTSSGWVGK